MGCRRGLHSRRAHRTGWRGLVGLLLLEAGLVVVMVLLGMRAQRAVRRSKLAPLRGSWHR